MNIRYEERGLAREFGQDRLLVREKILEGKVDELTEKSGKKYSNLDLQ